MTRFERDRADADGGLHRRAAPLEAQLGDALADPLGRVQCAQRVGMRAVLVPHSDIPADQQVPVDVTPDAVVQRLAELLDVVDAWS